jgi:hypothetical protein
MGTLCRVWIKCVCPQKGYPGGVAQNVGEQLFTSGSYRLGVHEPGADIDTILVSSICRVVSFGTENVTEESSVRDPNSLAKRIHAHPDVTIFSPVEGAAWTSICGTKPINSVTYFPTGFRRPILNRLRYWFTSGVKASTILKIYETSTKIEMVLLYSNPSLINYTKIST